MTGRLLEVGWRLPLVAGFAAGVAAAPFVPVDPGLARSLLLLLAALALIGRRGRLTPQVMLLLLVAAVPVGMSVGAARLAAIDRSAMSLGAAAGQVELTGFVFNEPKGSRGVIRFPLSTAKGRLMIEALDPGPERLPRIGDGYAVSGRAGEAPDWYRPAMERHGLKVYLRAEDLARTGASRTGLTGLIDRMRRRAETGLTRGMGAREAALARGFVIGEDAAIDERTTADFRASGLAHLLAVSGQNVALLGLLAWPALALLGTGLRTRRLIVCGLILLYIPLAGGGPSIQRAGVMGVAALLAVSANRAHSGIWAVALAAAVTLGLDPRAAADVGWQLSFAAVVGIGLAAAPLAARFGGGARGGLRQAAAEGAAITLAASLATAPLIAFHFGRLPVASIPANLLVMPAVAPAMWLGMISAFLGQVWSGLALPFNLLNSLLLAAIAQAATWFGRPHWAELEIELSLAGMLGLTVVLATAAVLALRLWRAPDPEAGRPVPRRTRKGLAVIVCGFLLAITALGLLGSGSDRRRLGPPPANGLRVEFLDVGQGDAILIRPSGGLPLLIDGGPPNGGLSDALRSAGVNHLGAVLLTHPDLDHYGGLLELLPSVPTDHFLFAAAPAPLLSLARKTGAEPLPVAAGRTLELGGRTRLELIWPRPGPTGPQPDPEPDTNSRSVVALLRWRGFRLLLPGDAEAESVPLDPGRIDVLKVAHHGSEDDGLTALLGRVRPRLAVISVGQGNRYGHPTPDTLGDLSRTGVKTLRTDEDGTVSLIVTPDGYRVETGR